MAIPHFLLDPPWRRATSAITSCSSDIGHPELPPPRLAWEPGERERLAGPDGTLKGAADEKALDRLLDRLDDGRPLPLAKVELLSDASLAVLADEAPLEAMDAGIARRMLARLGAPFVERALAWFRSRPPSVTLFASVAPIACPSLAPAAAEALLARDLGDVRLELDPVFSEAEAWLRRFPREAALGLLLFPDAPSTRAALTWLAARGHADTLHDVLASHGAARSSLSEATHRAASLAEESSSRFEWLALFAARDPALALDRLDALVPEPTSSELRALVPWVASTLATLARSRAVDWLRAHAEHSVPILRALAAPAAVEADRAARHDAVAADARLALAVLEGDLTRGAPDLEAVPSHIPPLPTFFDPSVLPAPRLLDGTPFPSDVVRALGEMLRFSPLARPYPGVALVRQACDPGSLDDLAVALLAAWEAADFPPLEQWVLESAAKIGADRAAGEVARLVRSWSRDSVAQRTEWDERARERVMVQKGNREWFLARSGCAVLGALARSEGPGSKLALATLDDLARHGAVSWLRKEAAAGLDGLRSERATARVVDEAPIPDFGLAPDGTLTLDFGQRRFRVDFDETLVPFVRDADGERLRAFPRARREDDPAAVATAKRTFEALRRDVKVVARQQVAALEAAMCTGRRFALGPTRARLFDHPLMRHVARRLLWAAVEEGEQPIPFRIAEDGTFADVDDTSLSIAADATVLLVHPIDLDASLTSWRELFASYRILQPFPQLGRETARVSDDELDETRWTRFEGALTSRGRLFGLTRSGWQAHAEAGTLVRWSRELPSGARLQVRVSPGLVLDGPGADDEHQSIVEATSSRRLGNLSPREYSEVTRELQNLCR